ncbi:MAG: dehydrogenase, partial [Maribacter sp.]|nr:dehydrogenase [Maribacter sp.]
MKNASKDKNKFLVSENSRRTFVKNTALLSGAMVLPSFQMDAMVNVFNDKKLKIALVGCGGRGTGAAVQALRADENVELVAMADAFEDRLKGSLMNISKEMGETKKVNVKDDHQFVGFDGAK